MDFPWEQKGYRKWYSSIAELHYIDLHILNESRPDEKIYMALIDYTKIYDMVLQRWIINCLKMYKIADEVMNFIEKTMKTWRVELTAGRAYVKQKSKEVLFKEMSYHCYYS